MQGQLEGMGGGSFPNFNMRAEEIPFYTARAAAQELLADALWQVHSCLAQNETPKVNSK